MRSKVMEVSGLVALILFLVGVIFGEWKLEREK